MGKAADATLLQSRMLNRGKGPAVHSLRAQIDRRNYSAYMKHRLETTPGLDIRQGEIVRLERLASGEWLLTTRLEVQYTAKAVTWPPAPSSREKSLWGMSLMRAGRTACSPPPS